MEILKVSVDGGLFLRAADGGAEDAQCAARKGAGRVCERAG